MAIPGTLRELIRKPLPEERRIFAGLSRVSMQTIEREKYNYGRERLPPNVSPMVPEVLANHDYQLRIFGSPEEIENGKLDPLKEQVLEESIEFLTGSYLLRFVKEPLDESNDTSPMVGIAEAELRRYAERFIGQSRYDAKITRFEIIRYGIDFNVPLLIRPLIERSCPFQILR